LVELSARELFADLLAGSDAARFSGAVAVGVFALEPVEAIEAVETAEAPAQAPA
jgi:hypothetical protein